MILIGCVKFEISSSSSNITGPSLLQPRALSADFTVRIVVFIFQRSKFSLVSLSLFGVLSILGVNVFHSLSEELFGFLFEIFELHVHLDALTIPILLSDFLLVVKIFTLNKNSQSFLLHLSDSVFQLFLILVRFRL